jgi:alkylhydroperoxidase family enzyme
LTEYAVKLTLEPAELNELDVEELRKSGLDDESILHACQIVAYFNFVNRLAEGLGVCLEGTPM